MKELFNRVRRLETKQRVLIFLVVFVVFTALVKLVFYLTSDLLPGWIETVLIIGGLVYFVFNILRPDN